MALFGKKMKDPVAGTARVVGTSRPGRNAAFSNLKMTLVVQADGVAPTTVEYRQAAVRVKKWPMPMQVLPVEVDRADPNRVKVLWDQVATGDERARAQADALAGSMQVGTTDTPAPRGEVAEGVAGIVDQIKQAFPDAAVNVQSGGSGGARPAAGGDRISQLERLAKLRDEGALSHDEFEAEKARILGEG